MKSNIRHGALHFTPRLFSLFNASPTADFLALFQDTRSPTATSNDCSDSIPCVNNGISRDSFV